MFRRTSAEAGRSTSIDRSPRGQHIFSRRTKAANNNIFFGLHAAIFRPLFVVSAVSVDEQETYIAIIFLWSDPGNGARRKRGGVAAVIDFRGRQSTTFLLLVVDFSSFPRLLLYDDVIRRREETITNKRSS